MKKEKTLLKPLLLVGLTTRTNNKAEMNPETGKIGNLAGSYWNNQIANQFVERVNPGVTYAVYTDYESDEHGEYTYFIGEEVKSLDSQNTSQFKTLMIPAGNYQKFTTEPGPMPEVVINAWLQLWQMTEKDFEGQRNYIADFEVYDQRASDPNRAVIDIYIGIK